MYTDTFYQNLNKPFFTPPPMVFKIVWPILYILMAISLFMIINSYGDLRYWAFGVFVIQLVLNLIWSPVFFILKQLKIALFISVLMTISVAFMIFIFFLISKWAAILQIPYFLWLCFATILNLAFVFKNPD